MPNEQWLAEEWNTSSHLVAVLGRRPRPSPALPQPGCCPACWWREESDNIKISPRGTLQPGRTTGQCSVDSSKTSLSTPLHSIRGTTQHLQGTVASLFSAHTLPPLHHRNYSTSRTDYRVEELLLNQTRGLDTRKSGNNSQHNHRGRVAFLLIERVRLQ